VVGGVLRAPLLDCEKRSRLNSSLLNIMPSALERIVKPERVPAVGSADGRRALFGWGVRTMSTGVRVQPAQLPQRNFLATLQFPVGGMGARAALSLARRLTASCRRCSTSRARSTISCPGVRGLCRAQRTPLPDRLPTAFPAAVLGSVVLLSCCSRCCSACIPSRRRHVARETVAPPRSPHLDGSIRLSGGAAFEKTWDVRLDDGMSRSRKHEIRNPLAGLVSVAATGYCSKKKQSKIEWVVSLLADRSPPTAGARRPLFASSTLTRRRSSSFVYISRPAAEIGRRRWRASRARVRLACGRVRVSNDHSGPLQSVSAVR